MTATTDILLAITDVQTDAELQLIFNACKQQQKIVRSIESAKALATFKVGDAVALTGLSPKYLNGTRGEISAVNSGTFTIAINEGADPRVIHKCGRSVRVPASCIIAA